MKPILWFCFLLGALASAVTAHAQFSSRRVRITAEAMQNAAASVQSNAALDRIKSVTRLDTRQAKALTSESVLVQRLEQALGGNFSTNDCPLLLPLEPGEVSYSTGTRTVRNWINEPPAELRALDQLQCEICNSHRSGILDEAQLKFAQDWLIQIYEDMLKSSWAPAE